MRFAAVAASASIMKIKESNMQVLGVILARAGSVGLKNKHLLPLLDRPVISYTFDHERASHLITRAVVSTDCRRSCRSLAATAWTPSSARRTWPPAMRRFRMSCFTQWKLSKAELISAPMRWSCFTVMSRSRRWRDRSRHPKADRRRLRFGSIVLSRRQMASGVDEQTQ